MAKRKPIITGRGRWAREWDGAYGLLPRRKRELPAVKTADPVATAKREIADNLAASRAAAMGDNMETNVIKSMSDRLSEIRKAYPQISEAGAMARLAESRNPQDQQLWRDYKLGIAPTGAVAKAEIDVAKAIKKMAKRCDQIMASDPSVRSRESAIAKVAASADPDDRRLWDRYRAAGQVAAVAQLPHSVPAPVGKGLESVVFDNLCRAIRDSFPGISSAQVRQWAQAVMAGNPPREMLTVTTRDAA